MVGAVTVVEDPSDELLLDESLPPQPASNSAAAQIET
jgi:hypothetical protein